MQGVDFLNGPLRAAIVKRIPVNRTPRVQQVEGLFDLAAAPDSVVRWDVSLPLHERPWAIGAIIGASGTGKTTIARSLFGESLVSGFDWPENKSVLDAFPAGMSIVEITMLLSSVGFSSPPSWLRPFHVLSTGEQFRVTIARALAEQHDLVAIDEFTSVVDRTVAQIGSAAVAHAVRARQTEIGLRMALGAAVFGTVLMFTGAWLNEKTRGFGVMRGVVQFLAFLPMAVPGLVLGLGYIFFFNAPNNPLNFLYATMGILVLNTVAHLPKTAALGDRR